MTVAFTSHNNYTKKAVISQLQSTSFSSEMQSQNANEKQFHFASEFILDNAKHIWYN